MMKTHALVAAAAVAAFLSLAPREARADGWRHRRPHHSWGFTSSYGYGEYYRPYRAPRVYYSPPICYYPRVSRRCSPW